VTHKKPKQNTQMHAEIVCYTKCTLHFTSRKKTFRRKTIIKRKHFQTKPPDTHQNHANYITYTTCKHTPLVGAK